MRSQLTRGYYIPRGSVEVIDHASDAVAYLHADRRSRPCATIFFGTKARPVFDYAFSSDEARTATVERAFKARRAHKARVIAARAKRSLVALRNAKAKNNE